MSELAGAARDATRDWPGYAGIGGLNAPALRPIPPSSSARVAREAIRRWSARLAPASDGSVAARSFPFGAVLDHYQAAGRHYADGGLVADLRDVDAALRGGGFRPLDAGWLLAEWLPATFDHGHGTYETFLGQSLLTALHHDRVSRGVPIGDVLDTTLAACAADLVRREAAAIDGAGDERRQRARTYAAIQALLRVAEPAAELRELAPDLDKVGVALIEAAGTPGLAEVARDAAALVLAEVPELVRHVVEVTMLPITRLHDEAMFLRCVQMFEVLYEQTARRMRQAGVALLARDARRAEAELAAADSRLACSPALYRVLTSMPKDVFAVFRGLTDGRSANQSPGYRWVEQSSSPRGEPALPPRASPIVHTGPTLQECYLAAAPDLAPGDAELIAGALRRLDRSWLAMKRTHWGITLKIIGTVPGTGGTDGAGYLEKSAGLSLFPLLRTDQHADR